LIRLHRQSPNGIITGQFHCEIPSGTNTNSVLVINIGMSTYRIVSIVIQVVMPHSFQWISRCLSILLVIVITLLGRSMC
jgi:hypothetical protein